MKVSVPRFRSIVFLTMLALASCTWKSTGAAVTTQAPTSVMTTSAELQGLVVRSARNGRVAFQIRPANARRWLARTEWQRFAHPITNFTSYVEGLSPDMEYEVRALLVTRGVLHHGKAVIFRTEGSPPVAITGAATDIGTRSARLVGTHALADQPPAAIYFEIGLTTNYGQRFPALSLSSPPDLTVSNFATVVGLVPDVEYHFRLMIENGGEVSHGADATFRTLPCVAANSIAVVTNCTEADLLAAIESSGQVRFECDGVITLTRPIEVACPLTLDAAERAVTLSGGGSNRIFHVLAGSSLMLRRLLLVDGRVQGTNGSNAVPPDSPGQPGQSVEGGAILASNATFVAVGCTFKNCFAEGGRGGDSPSWMGWKASGGAAAGGVISARNSLIQLTNCFFWGNAAQGGFSGFGGFVYDPFPIPGQGRGGVLASVSSTIHVFNCNFDHNGATSSGGAIDALGSAASALTVLDSHFWGNGCAFNGGAIRVFGGNASLLYNRFERNSAWGLHSPAASYGGAVSWEAAGEIIGCDFERNSCRGSPAGETAAARGYGGGIALINGRLAISQCTFRENAVTGGRGNQPDGGASSGFGGAISSSGILNVTNSTFAMNKASGGEGYLAHLGRGLGGAVAVDRSITMLNFCTIASNHVSDLTGTNSAGGGIAKTGGTLLMANTLLQFNSANSDSNNNASGPADDAGYNISSDETPGLYWAASFNNVAAVLGPLGDYGGLTLTFPLLDGSPAIDAGDPTVVSATDQRGIIRPQRTRPDIGAYERE